MGSLNLEQRAIRQLTVVSKRLSMLTLIIVIEKHIDFFKVIYFQRAFFIIILLRVNFSK